MSNNKFGFEAAFQAAEQQSSNSAPKQKFDYLKIDATPKQIRFLTLDGAESVYRYSEHYVKFKNDWSRSYSCPDYQNDGPSTCMLCKIKSGAEVIQNNYGMKFIMQVIERDAPVMNAEGKPTEETADKLKVFKFSPFLMQSLSAYYQQNGDLGDRDYKISLIDNPDSSSKIKKVYVIVPASKKAIPLDDESEELAEKRAKLSDIEPPYDEADINRMLTFKPKGDMAVSKEETKKNLKKFLDDDEDDTLSSLPKVSSVDIEVPAAVGAAVEDDDEDAEFWATLKKKKAQ